MSGSGPTKPKTGRADIERVIRDEEVVRLKVAGYTHEQAAAAVGLASRGGVTDILTKWINVRGPSSELVEQYRRLQGAQCDQLLAAHWEAGVGERGPHGDWIAVPDPTVIAPLVRVMERKAKLYGLDMPAGLSISVVPTAEQFAAFLGWDCGAPDPGPALGALHGQSREVRCEAGAQAAVDQSLEVLDDVFRREVGARLAPARGVLVGGHVRVTLRVVVVAQLASLIRSSLAVVRICDQRVPGAPGADPLPAAEPKTPGELHVHISAANCEPKPCIARMRTRPVRSSHPEGGAAPSRINRVAPAG